MRLEAVSSAPAPPIATIIGIPRLHRRDERGPVRAGKVAVIPAMVSHGVVNTGDEPLKVVGFFCESEITSTFEAPLQPIGAATVTM